MLSLFNTRTTTSLFIAAASAFFLTACDRSPTDPPQPTTQGIEREDGANRDALPQPGTPIAPPPVEPATPGQPATPGSGTGTQ